MNWEALGAVAEATGALVIIPTLVYLSLQIRENTKTNRVAARQHFIDQLAAFFDDFIHNPELGDIHGRGNQNADAMTEDERKTYGRLIQKSFLYMSSQHYQREIGTMDDATWHEVRVYTDFYAEQPGIWAWWPRNRGAYSRSFRHYMDDAIRKAKETRDSV